LRIVIEQPEDGEEDLVIFRCRNISSEIIAQQSDVKPKPQDDMMIAYIGSEIHRVSCGDVFYFETVDNKSFIYCDNEVYESKQKLYEIEALNVDDFLRISKSTIINLSKIKTLTPSMSGRLEALLHNGEIVVISRQYVSALKKKLGV